MNLQEKKRLSYIFHILIRTLGVLLFVFFSNTQIFGCSCVIPTVCQAYSRAEAVFTGKLVRIEKDEKSHIETVFAHFQVGRTFKGKTESMEIVRFVIGSCERTFNIGEEYFVYKDPNTNFNNICNRTDTLLKSASEIEYAKKLSNSKPIYSISGRIGGLSLDDLRKTRVIVIKGHKQFDVMADRDGFYEFIAKDSTNYSIKILLPFEATVFTNNLWMSEESKGRTIGYSLQFKPNECDFREIEVSKTATAKKSKLLRRKSVKKANKNQSHTLKGLR